MKYSLEYSPPAAVLKVKFINPILSYEAEIEAKLDTGADITVVPEAVIDRLGIVPAGRIDVTSFDGDGTVRYTYFVNLAFLGFTFEFVEVIGARRRDSLLGRDVLNRLKAVLDGKALEFDLVDP